MSSSDFSRPSKPKYFSEFMVKGYIFPAILLAAIFSTILAIAFQFDLLSQLSNDNSKIFTFAFVGFFLVVLSVYSCSKIRYSQVGFNDAISFGYFFAGIFYLIYLAIYGEGFQYFDAKNILIGVLFIVFGLIISLLSSAFYNYGVTDEEIDDNCYFAKTSKKFGFISIILCAIVINFLFFILLNIKYDFIDTLMSKGYAQADEFFFESIKSYITSNTALLCFVIAGVVFLLTYAISALPEKNINALDLFIWGFIFNIPVLLAMVYLLGDNEDIMNYIIAGGLSVIVIVFAIIRSKTYRGNIYKLYNKSFLKNFFSVRNIFLAFGLMGLVVTFIYIERYLDILSVFTKDDTVSIILGVIPYAIVYLACVLGFVYFAFGLLKSIIIFTKKEYDSNDVSILFNIAFGFYFLIALFLIEEEQTLLNIVILASYIIICLDTAFLRNSEIK